MVSLGSLYQAKDGAMEAVVPVYKPDGWSPLQALEALRVQVPKWRGEKMSYAGRLDPLAEGLLIMLIGKANQKREKYLGLTKEYEFEAVLGLTSDSWDALGLVKLGTIGDGNQSEKQLGEVFRKMEGELVQPYPPFSSRTVAGKPLFEWAKEGKLGEVEIPSRRRRVERLQLVGGCRIDVAALAGTACQRIKAVKGKFRQEAVLAGWQNLAGLQPGLRLPLIRGNCRVSSGTYVRGLVEEAGRQLGCGAMVWRIVRTQVGEYGVEDCIFLTNQSVPGH